MRRPIQRKKRLPKKGHCQFCKEHTEPDYKETDTLKRLVSERGKITGRIQSGTCQKHQKQISTAVKRARYLALIPFIVRPS